MRNATSTLTDLHSVDRLGVSGKPRDRAFSNTSAVAGTTVRGSVFTGGRAASANTGTGGALNAFTLPDWFRPSSTTQIGNSANLFVWQDSAWDGFQLLAKSAGGYLRPIVNRTGVDSSASFSALQERVFFAAVHDSSLGSNQAGFYLGGTSSAVAEVGEATLAGRAVDITSGAMGIGDNGALASPFEDLPDQLQFSTGAMDGAQLEDVCLAAVPEPSSFLLIAVGAGFAWFSGGGSMRGFPSETNRQHDTAQMSQGRPEARNANPGRKARRGFTLVELLVVIAVLAVLAALALPMYSAMVAKGEFAESGAGLRAIGAALGLYAAENNMEFPKFRAGPGGNSGAYWRLSLADYLAKPGEGTGSEASRLVRTSTYKKTFWSRGYLRAAGLKAPPDDVATGNGSHMINWFFARYDNDPAFPGGVVRRHDPRVVGAREPYMVDGALGSNNQGRSGNARFTTTETGVPQNGWADYYGGKVNALYIDGSVRVLTENDGADIREIVANRDRLE